MSVLLIVLGVVLCIIGLLLVALGVFIVSAVYQADKLMFGLPWLRWLSLDETSAMGFSKFWCKIILPIFHEHGYLEVRIKGIDLEHMPPKIKEAMEEAQIQELLAETELPFEYGTVALHEFKLTKRGGRRKKFLLKSLLSPLSRWQPVPA